MVPLLALLCGCFVQVSSYECRTTTTEVDDDELVGDMTATAAEVLGAVEGTFGFAALYEEGGPVTGEVTVTRGEGPAIAFDGERLENVTRGEPGVGTLQDPALVICGDSFEVPVEVVFATDDDQIAFSMSDLAMPVARRAGGEPELFEVKGDVDPERVEVMPSLPGADGTANLALHWTPDGALSVASLWWFSESTSQAVLETE
jgi:hypothetical protein